MAKETKTTAATQSQEDAYAELKGLLSEEELAILMKLTGQEQQGGGGTRTPVIKVNYKERADVNGKKVAKGNFVIGQKSGLVEGKKVLQEVGTDLGDTLKAIILKVGTQYSYWNENKALCCSSQIITEKGETPVGYNLKNVCSDGSCPRRKEGVDKKDRCPSQYVVYFRMPEGTKLPDGTDCPVAMMYVKGTSYKPFQTYLDEELKGIPTIAVVTEISTTEEEQGSTIYFVESFKKGAVVPKEVFKQNFELVSGVDKQLLEYKDQQKQKLLADKSKDAPVLSAGDTGGKDAVVINGDDGIQW